MKKPEKVEPVMEFVFQTIKLDQVADLIPHTYRSKYEAIRTQVIDKIKIMPEGETFIFQPQDKKTKLDDNLVARICHGINTGLVRENLNWKISFSKKASAFVVAPFKRYKLGKYKKSKPSEDPEHIDGVKVTRVVNKASYLDPIPKYMTSEEVRQMDHLLGLTHDHFGKTLKDLQTKVPGIKDRELSNLKKAFLYIGRNAMGIKLAHMGKLLGLQSSSTTTMCKRAIKDPKAQDYVRRLSAAIDQNGGGN